MSNGVQKGKDNALAVQQWIAELDAVGDYGECGVMNIDRNLIDITDDTIENIDLGYVITIHKSQGSQWPKCIFMLPSYASRMTCGRVIEFHTSSDGRPTFHGFEHPSRR
jgi:hypothetical protein